MGIDMISNQTPLTKEFLENILKKEILEFKVSAGSNPGDNFTSILIGLEVIVVDKPKDPLYLLFKTFPQHPTRQKFLEEINLFLKEYQIYDLWLPELVDFQRSVIGNDEKELLVPAMPELVAGAAIDYANADISTWEDLNPVLNNFLLMVDVRKTYGFKMDNKLKSLGHHHVKIVLDELAKYHTLGYAYKVHRKLPNIRTKFPFMLDPFYENPEQRSTMEAMIKVNMQLVMDTCSEFLEQRPEIAHSLSKFEDPALAADYLTLFLDPDGMDEEKVESWMRFLPNQFIGSPPQEQWIVPGHGDCWTNNMLFKKNDSGRVTETILVDLQIARESCIMTDLVYFMYTSTDTEFRKQYLDKMLKWYYQRFLHYCVILKVDIFPGFSLGNFLRKFHRSKIIGFLFATVALPIVLQKPETTMNLDNVEIEEGDSTNDNDEWAAMLKNTGRDDDDTKLLRERFTELIEEFYEEGVL